MNLFSYDSFSCTVMANTENWMDEIDSIVMHHIETIENVFDDLKEAAAASSSENPNLMSERIDDAQQR